MKYRIGNLVRSATGKIMQVVEIGKDVSLIPIDDTLSPIEEIYPIEDIPLSEVKYEAVSWINNELLKDIKYIYELQNIFFIIEGRELKII